MWLLYGVNCVILASTVLTDPLVWRTDGQTDGRTDGIAMAYTRYSIYAVARKNHQKQITEIYQINHVYFYYMSNPEHYLTW